MADLLSRIWTADAMPALSARNWERLLAQARACRLQARLADRLEARGWADQVPEAPARHLESARRFADRLRWEVLFEVDHLLAALRPLPTPIVLLKGAAYLAAGLPPGRGRLFSDVDIMVGRDQLPAVELALFAAGWIPEKLQPYDDRYYRRWMHELPPLQHVQRRTALDVHHTIAPPTARYAIDGARLLATCVPLAGEPRLSVLAPVDMALHSAVHLLQEGEFGSGLRDLLDLNDLLIHFGAADVDFWRALLQRARELGAGVPLAHALFQVDRLFGTRPPGRLAGETARLAPNPTSRRVVNAALAIALRPDHPSCDGALTWAARKLLYARSHWLRMPWYQITPHLLRKAWMRAAAARREASASAAVAPAAGDWAQQLARSDRFGDTDTDRPTPTDAGCGVTACARVGDRGAAPIDHPAGAVADAAAASPAQATPATAAPHQPAPPASPARRPVPQPDPR